MDYSSWYGHDLKISLQPGHTFGHKNVSLELYVVYTSIMEIKKINTNRSMTNPMSRTKYIHVLTSIYNDMEILTSVYESLLTPLQEVVAAALRWW